MTSLCEIDTLAKRLRAYVAMNDKLKPETAHILEEALRRGEVERSAIARVTGLPERTARRVLNNAVEAGLLASATPKSPVFWGSRKKRWTCFFPDYIRKLEQERRHCAATLSSRDVAASELGPLSLDTRTSFAQVKSVG